MAEQKFDIRCCDCLELTKALPDDSVDLVLGSPPYEAARTYGIGFNLKGQDWVDWAVERFLDQYRICKGLVCWVVEGQTRSFRWSATPALLMADLHRAGVHLRKPPIYHRVGIPGSGGPDWWRNDYEFCICASKGKLPWSDNTATGHPPKWAPGGAMSYRLTDGSRRNQWGMQGNTRKNADGVPEKMDSPSHYVPKAFKAGKRPHTKSRADGTDEIQYYGAPPVANPGNVLKVSVGGGRMGSDLAHESEAPYPEALADPFVISFCPPDGTVFEPFSGSGTTAAVALRHGRRFLGCDIRASQVELTRRRVSEVQGMMF